MIWVITLPFMKIRSLGKGIHFEDNDRETKILESWCVNTLLPVSAWLWQTPKVISKCAVLVTIQKRLLLYQIQSYNGFNQNSNWPLCYGIFRKTSKISTAAQSSRDVALFTLLFCHICPQEDKEGEKGGNPPFLLRTWYGIWKCSLCSRLIGQSPVIWFHWKARLPGECAL